MSEHWIVINSDANKEYFPDNEPYRFSVYLRQPLNLEGDLWTVALTELYARGTPGNVRGANRKRRGKATNTLLYVYCSLCEPIIVDGDRQPLLRRVQESDSNVWQASIANPYEVKARLSNELLNQIDLYINDDEGEPASFLTERVSVTLHLLLQSET